MDRHETDRYSDRYETDRYGTDWRGSAACRGMDPDLFFPIGNSTGFAVLVQIDEAKEVCRTCPVARQCLRWAMDAGAVDGIWGGTTEEERRAVRRRGALGRPGPETTAA
ncbi:WhiB family transcriptional regulator [Streptomyces sp. NPDC016845]|uniref:WhiB family transcriptional regulator n=1 Tax=Streptomyces sp. NPDC016845 TaxID=3364972 RepID=UPI00379D5335